MSKKQKISENYLEKVPLKKIERWTKGDDGLVTLEIDNTGLMNKIAQKLLKKPKVSFVHLDEFGSFVWENIDGQSNIITIGQKVKERFGEKAEPLYPRLAKYVKILESYKFISL